MVVTETASQGNKKAASKAFEMPRVSVGDDVLLLANTTDTGHNSLGIVVAVHKRAIDVMHHRTRQLYVGLRHKDDPDLVTHPTLLHDTHGCWCETDKIKRLANLEEDLSAINTRVTALFQAVKELTDEVRRIKKPV